MTDNEKGYKIGGDGMLVEDPESQKDQRENKGSAVLWVVGFVLLIAVSIALSALFDWYVFNLFLEWSGR